MANESLAAPPPRERMGEGRALTVEIDASAERWRIEAGGQAHEVAPPDLGDPARTAPPGIAPAHLHPELPDAPSRSPREAEAFVSAPRPGSRDGEPLTLGAALLQLRSMAGLGLDADKSGRLLNPSDAAREQIMLAIARSIGASLTALLPPSARSSLAVLAGSAPGQGDALVRIRVRVREPQSKATPADLAQANTALTLPWELLLVADRFPVAEGKLSIAREAVTEGITEGLPSPPPRFSVVAHVAAPQHEGLPELRLEEAAFRMARALVSLEDRTYFTDLGTLDDLKRAAAKVNPVLLHFAGHGLPGRLLFEDRDGGPDEVETNHLLLSLTTAMGHLPSAIWLSCCYGAGLGQPEQSGRSTTRAWDLLGPQTSSIAADLHRAGVPQVLGYFGPVPDALAVEVDRSLFETLARTGSTLKAVRVARLRSQEAIEAEGGWARFPLAWTLLGLYHRGDDVPLLDAKSPPDAGLAIDDVIERDPEALHGLEALNHGFIGRRRLLAKMRRHRNDDRHNVLGLYGLGGLGKTATMIRLSRVFAGGGQGWQERVVALSLQKRDATFAALRESVVEAVSRHPARPTDWDDRLKKVEDGSNDRGVSLAQILLSVLANRVLYIDNAETLQVDPREGAADSERVPWCDPEVASFFQTLCSKAPSNVTVLMTTRYRPRDTGGKWVPIEPCTKDEIFRMTRWFRALRRLPPSLRSELATRRLAGHPRAVEWADALIDEQASRWSDEGHELRDDSDPDEVREHVYDPALARLPEKATPDLLLGALIERLGPVLRALLGECCAIGLPVPLEVVRRLGEGSEVLQARGLLTCFDGTGWAVHAFVREAAGRAGAGVWTKAGRGVLADYWLMRRNAKGGAPELVSKEALEHLLAAERWAEAWKVTSGLYETYHHRSWLRAGVGLFEGLMGHAWPDVERGFVLNATSAALTGIGRYVEAEQRAREAIVVKERAYGTREHPEVAVSLNHLAAALRHQERYDEAEDTYLKAIAIRGRSHDTRKHRDIAFSLDGLGNVFRRQERYAESVDAHRTAIDILKRSPDTRESAEITVSLHGLATALNRLGRHDEAERIFREGIDILRRLYGTPHTSIGTFLQGQANALEALGHVKEAEKCLVDAAAIDKELFGEQLPPARLPILVALARLLLPQGRAGEVLAYADDAWQGARKAGDLLRAVQAGPYVADALDELGRLDEARKVRDIVGTLLRELPEGSSTRVEAERRIGFRT
jgi:tetratricopeptide (TPR) repeat protein